MSKSKKRIAVCIYGTWRGWDVAKHQILNIKHEINIRLNETVDQTLYIDYFISTWDNNLEFTIEKDVITGESHQPIDVDKIKSDFDECNLVSMQTFKQIEIKDFSRCANSGFSSYLAQQAMLEKAMYESKYNFTYDYAMFIRPDVVYNFRMYDSVRHYILDADKWISKIPSRSVVVESNIEYTFDYYIGVYVGDVFWFGSSVASDLYFQLYDNTFRRTPDKNTLVSASHTVNAMHMMYCNLHVYHLFVSFHFIRPNMYHISNKIGDIEWASNCWDELEIMEKEWDGIMDTYYRRNG